MGMAILDVIGSIGASILHGLLVFFGISQQPFVVQIIALVIAVALLWESTVTLKSYSMFSGFVSFVISLAIIILLAPLGVIKFLALLVFNLLSNFFSGLQILVIGIFVILIIFFIIDIINRNFARGRRKAKRQVEKAEEEVTKKELRKIGEKLKK
ncbi:hypothetical protein COS75_03320 [Candidatus Pacearchaeota archaeon CG06_land_8_20_14_3_00_35_12]|nr:MAG: hypothetical protein COS75_03320 [Candidatus Pacearchaeota archaeon CG06_land_8_20_14_3_00_35_12]